MMFTMMQKNKWEISWWLQVRSYMVLGRKILYNPFWLMLLRKNTARGFKQIFRWLSFNVNVRGKVPYSSALSENTHGVLQEDWIKWHHKHMLLFAFYGFKLHSQSRHPPYLISWAHAGESEALWQWPCAVSRKRPFCLPRSLSRRVTQAYPRNKALAIVIICIDA